MMGLETANHKSTNYVISYTYRMDAGRIRSVQFRFRLRLDPVLFYIVIDHFLCEFIHQA